MSREVWRSTSHKGRNSVEERNSVEPGRGCFCRTGVCNGELLTAAAGELIGLDFANPGLRGGRLKCIGIDVEDGVRR